MSHPDPTAEDFETVVAGLPVELFDPVADNINQGSQEAPRDLRGRGGMSQWSDHSSQTLVELFVNALFQKGHLLI